MSYLFQFWGPAPRWSTEQAAWMYLSTGPLRESSRERAPFKRGREETRKLLRGCGPQVLTIQTPVREGPLSAPGRAEGR